jgi:hypothetical protein
VELGAGERADGVGALAACGAAAEQIHRFEPGVETLGALGL